MTCPEGFVVKSYLGGRRPLVHSNLLNNVLFVSESMKGKRELFHPHLPSLAKSLYRVVYCRRASHGGNE